MLYIDAFNHILPKKYQAVLEQKVPNRDMSSNLSRYAETVPTPVSYTHLTLPTN